MAQPVWLTPAGNLGTYPEGVFFQFPLLAEEPDPGDPIYFKIIAGELPDGVQVATDGLIVGVPKAIANIQGIPVDVARDITSKFAVRAYTTKVVAGVTVINRLADRTFSITVSGQDAPEWVTPSGPLYPFPGKATFDGTQIYDLQIQYTDNDPGDVTVVRLVEGSLPPGLTLSPRGRISGVIPAAITATEPVGFDVTPFDLYSFSPQPYGTNANYSFTLELTDGKNSALREFSIFVWSRSLLSADTTIDTADNTFITADGVNTWMPIILNIPGSIGTVQSNNYFAYKFNGVDFANDNFVFTLNSGTLPPGTVLDPVTGWLYGYIPDLGLTERTYAFSLRVFKTNEPTYTSQPYSYSLIVNGPIETNVVWTTPATAAARAQTPSPLGTIDNGAISELYVEAVNSAGIELEYRLKPGPGSPNYIPGVYSSLPQGLTLMPSGNIVGRVNFNTFALDGGTTVFDVNSDNRAITAPTTFDLTFNFVVEAFGGNGIISVFKEFSILVNRAYNKPYENLYIQAMPPQNDRDLINDLLQDSSIFPSESLYRADDPNFGRATQVVYDHAFGLTAATYVDYVASLEKNHYWKNLVLGEIKTAEAVDPVTGQVIYEVIYSEIVDNLVNDQGESVSKEVVIPYPLYANTAAEIDSVYPNSLTNMRDQVIDVVGQVSNMLPLWMLSKQSSGRVLGFTPAWVIAYVLPGQSGQISYNIRKQFGSQLNLVDFEVDRYELDRALTNNWDPVIEQWVPQPPAATTFDLSTGSPTIFDGGSVHFITPVDIYLDSNTTDYDKYLVFPKRNIISPDRPVIPSTVVNWTNTTGSAVAWTNATGRAVSWINDPL
jgi:hypothetical protein